MFGKQLESRSAALCYPMLGVALMFLCRMCVHIYCLIFSLCLRRGFFFVWVPNAVAPLSFRLLWIRRIEELSELLNGISCVYSAPTKFFTDDSHCLAIILYWYLATTVKRVSIGCCCYFLSSVTNPTTMLAKMWPSSGSDSTAEELQSIISRAAKSFASP